MTTLQPFANRILVRLDPEETQTASGLFIPDQAKEKSKSGIVLATGNGVHRPIRIGDITSQVLISVEEQGIKVGDRVLLNSAYAGSATDEKGVILADLIEVLAVVS